MIVEVTVPDCSDVSLYPESVTPEDFFETVHGCDSSLTHVTPSTPIASESDSYVTASGIPDTASAPVGQTTALSVVPEAGMVIAPLEYLRPVSLVGAVPSSV